MFLIADPNGYDAFKAVIRRFLALNAIKEDKERIGTLSEEDRERVGQRLKDPDSSIWFKLISVYRYIAKASKDGIATLDMGIPSLGERLTLTGRVKDFLGDQEVLLS